MTQDELIALIDQAAEEGWTELDLSGKGLSELPPEIGKLTQLETLILGKWEENKQGSHPNLKGFDIENNRVLPSVSGNLLTRLPSEIRTLTKLVEIDLSGNQLNNFPTIVTELKNLKKLTIIRSNLTKVPDEIGQLQNLTILNLAGNEITVIPTEIKQLKNLTRLDLNRNKIDTIPPEISQLQTLVTLNLSGNEIVEVIDALGQLHTLTELYLGGNQIAVISTELGQLCSLNVLDLGFNRLTEVPTEIGQLQNLLKLFLGGNQLLTIPAGIYKLKNLTRLHLYSNKIVTIPERISQLENLAILLIGSNPIEIIPNEIFQLHSLTTLGLANCQIHKIPDEISQLQNLTRLDFNNNKITIIPDAFSQLTNLTWLAIWNNQILVIPNTFAKLENLIELNLSGNKISVIPDAIVQLKKLETLSLSSNKITVIPNTISRLRSLSTLSLWGNQITEIPLCLEFLPKLKKLDLRRNPLSISPEILGPRSIKQNPCLPETIFNYCRELRSGEKRQLNEAKLLLIGQGSVGKTSLIKRLIHDTYDPNESQTDGLNVTDWTIEVNTKPIRLNVWDFGGQEIYHATHQFFLTKRSLYILTCNCRTSEDENRIEYWLKLIQSFGGNSPVIIVGNKSDEQPLDINRKALKDKYPNIKAILETSCANGRGIEKLRTTITQEVAKLHDVYNLLPLTWFQVKEQLEEMNEDFITYNRYTGLCYEQKVTEEQSQDQLIDLLHNLGLVLNFRDHPILKDTNVLNPDWVTTGIYAILSDEPLKTKTKGILTTSDLDRILPSDRYPAKRYPYLIELMKEFQLGFRIDSCTPAKFLIPGLLPKDEPENTNLQGDTLDFQYHYRILPESILSRFIVLTHEDIHEHTYWRSGVMLHHTEGDSIENIARIKADPEDKKIFIAISGKNASRRTFLTMLRKVFAKIHNSFADLAVTEWVPVPDHPDHPPIDYQELLGAEAMGDATYTIGKLRKRIDLRKLLDGYESLDARQQRRRDERGKEGRFEEEQLGRSIRDINITITNDNNNQQSQEVNQPMSNTINQHGQGDNFAGDQVQGDKIHTQINNGTDLTQAARDIKTLLTELDQQYDSNTPDGQKLMKFEAIEAIQSNPTLKKRVFNAVKEGSTAALEAAIEHPVAKPVIATIKGFIDA